MRLSSIPRLPLAAAGFLATGAVIALVPDAAEWRDRIWLTGLVLTGVPVSWATLRGMLKGNFASDVVAMLAIAGAIALGQPLAGLVVVLMQTGGEALEAYAVTRASSAVAALEADAPRIAHRLTGGRVADIAATDIALNDELLVRPGELVPCDGVVVAGTSHLDTSRLTGEAMPVRAVPGSTLMSGSVNQEGALTMKALRTSQESQYAKIVDLVRSAQASKSPLQRTADKWAVWFTPLTLAACASAWFVSHEWTRVLAVLVVATPCPLILAAPVAIIGGINRAARRSIIVRNGGALEALAGVTTAVFDKTGTLTIGQPSMRTIVSDNGVPGDHLLALAAAVEQGSGHLLARVIVHAATQRNEVAVIATELVETPGSGVVGTVEGDVVAVGSADYVRRTMPALADRVSTLDRGAEGLRAYVGTKSGAVARIEFADELRADLGAFFSSLTALGVTDVQLLSGDKPENVAKVAAAVGIKEFAGDLSPEDKVNRVRALEASGHRVLMVGDGTNDAPALSSATVGVALAGHGGGVVTEAADVVLLIDDPSRVAEAIEIGRRSLRIAKESIGVGLGLSFVGMGIAASGHLTPITGALAQEAIDVAVILNALRASFDVARRDGAAAVPLAAPAAALTTTRAS